MPSYPPFPPFPPFPGSPSEPPAPAGAQPGRPAEGPPVLTVSALNQAVARTLERNFPLCWVGGEISNFTRAASGHWYFTLKDSGAQVRAVMFRGRAQYAGFMPREGDKVEVRALVTLYAPRGDYQLSVEAIRRAGVGNLFEAFLQLKERLGREGLFDPERKRPLPYFVRTVGIVTSPQAAALRDVLTALARRAPHVRVVLYPAPVQGAGSAERIAQAIAAASRRAECDVLLVCRGGGSIEDLWSFNEEIVARAIAACSMPVIAGVGHETDFTIADFAADVRAPTPTAAAELASAAREDWLATLRGDAVALRRGAMRAMRTTQQTLDAFARSLQSPRARIGRERAHLAVLETRLRHAHRNPLLRARMELNHLRARVAAPPTAAWRAALAHLQTRLAPPDVASLRRELRHLRYRLAAPGTDVLRGRLAHLRARLAPTGTRALRSDLMLLQARLAPPRTAQSRQTLLHLQARLAPPDTAQARRHLAHLQARLPAPDVASLRTQVTHLRARLAPPDVATMRTAVEGARRRGAGSIQASQKQRRQALAALQAQLELLNPQRTLERGYAIVTDAEGRIVRTPQQLRPGAEAGVRVAGGSAKVTLADVRLTQDDAS